MATALVYKSEIFNFNMPFGIFLCVPRWANAVFITHTHTAHCRDRRKSILEQPIKSINGQNELSGIEKSTQINGNVHFIKYFHKSVNLDNFNVAMMRDVKRQSRTDRALPAWTFRQMAQCQRIYGKCTRQTLDR